MLAGVGSQWYTAGDLTKHMCGIVGFTGNPNKAKLDEMTGAIIHRGPDDDAGLQSKYFSAGMRRLAIIDLTDSLYPMKNEDDSIFCLLNGEIYNYKELREELKAAGHDFKSDSDSEVIVHGYEQWGVNVLQKLRGMFTIALYDHNKEELLIARDRLGIKPMYYADHNGQLIFASEIKAIFAAWDVPRDANDSVVYKFLFTRVHDDGKETFFKYINRLLPAHYMLVDKDANYRISKYWELEVNKEFGSKKSDEEYASELRGQFVEAMRLHLITDVPLGVTLSGGMDSSGVAAVAADLLKSGTDLHTHDRLLTFSAVHPGESIDESEYIAEVVRHTGSESIKVTPNVNDFWNEIDEWVYYQEEPTISTAPYAYYVVMREAHKRVKVLLSGQGGDELFAGYIPYFMSYIQTARDANAFMSILRESIKGFDIYKAFFKQKLDSVIKKNQFLNVNNLLTISAADKDEMHGGTQHKHFTNLNERLRFDLLHGSVPNLLRYEDKNSMAHSIESRVPFLDHKFVEYALSLPADQKIKNGWNRYVYRNAMKGLMPEKNRLRRSKVGFVNSEWQWMREKRELISGIFGSEPFNSRKYWNGHTVLHEFNEAVEGRKQGDYLMFWRILSVELWLRRYVDKF